MYLSQKAQEYLEKLISEAELVKLYSLNGDDQDVPHTEADNQPQQDFVGIINK